VLALAALAASLTLGIGLPHRDAALLAIDDLRSHGAPIDVANPPEAQVVVSGATVELKPAGVLLNVAPSDRQLVAAAYARIAVRYGSRVCVLDDGTPAGSARAELMLARAPDARRASAATPGADAFVEGCIASSDATFVAAQQAMLFMGPRAADRLYVSRLFEQVLRPGFDPARIDSLFGDVYEAAPAPLARTPAVKAIAREYRARTGLAAGDDVLRTYAAAQIAAQAARGPKPQYATILGEFSFGRDGESRGAGVRIRKL